MTAAPGTGTLPFMEAPLAIYEALVHANVPIDAARNAAEKLERDMIHALAIRQDLQRLEARVETGFALVDQRFVSIDQRFASTDLRFASIDQRFDALHQEIESALAAVRKEVEGGFTLVGERFVSFENRIVIKLGALMIALFTVAIGVLALAG